MLEYKHNLPVWVGLQALYQCFGRRFGKGLFLCQDKPAGCCLLAVLGIQVRAFSLETLAVKAAAVDVLPACFPSVAGDRFLTTVNHNTLDGVLD